MNTCHTPIVFRDTCETSPCVHVNQVPCQPATRDHGAITGTQDHDYQTIGIRDTCQSGSLTPADRVHGGPADRVHGDAANRVPYRIVLGIMV